MGKYWQLWGIKGDYGLIHPTLDSPDPQEYCYSLRDFSRICFFFIHERLLENIGPYLRTGQILHFIVKASNGQWSWVGEIAWYIYRALFWEVFFPFFCVLLSYKIFRNNTFPSIQLTFVWPNLRFSIYQFFSEERPNMHYTAPHGKHFIHWLVKSHPN